jgi:hypothetical protein
MAFRLDLGFDPRQAFFSGEDLEPIEVTLLQDSSGALVDVSAALAIFAVFNVDPDSGAATTQIFQKTVGGGITLEDPSPGVITIQIDDDDTDGLDGDYYYELQINVGGVIKKNLFGAIRLRPPGIA